MEEEKNFRREKIIREKLKEMQKSGFNFNFEETPDSYIVKFTDKETKERIFHFLKMDGTLPVDDKRYKIEDVIKAVLLFPELSIKEAILKFQQEKE